MSLSRLWNRHGILVYRNAFVYSSLDKLPPIVSTHTVVRKVFAEKEAQILYDGDVWYLEDHRRRVEIFYKTVRFVNGPEIERIETCLLERTGNRVALTTVTTTSTIAILSAIPMNQPGLFLVPFSYIVYMVIFANRIERQKEMYKKIESLQFFEDTLLELDHRKFLQEMDLKKE